MSVYHYRNMTKAAESLFVSQPSISNAIKELEAELQTPLFWRNNGMEATMAREKLAQLAAPLIEQFDSIPETISLHLSQTPPKIKIGVGTIAEEFLKDTLTDVFKEKHHLIQKIDYCGCNYLMNCVDEGSMDFALITSINTLQDTRFHIHQIFASDVYFYTNVSNPLAGCDLIKPSQLENIPIAGFTEYAVPVNEFQDMLNQMLDSLSMHQIVLYSTNLATIFRTIESNIASAVLLKGLLNASVKNIVAIPIDTDKHICFSLIWKKDRSLRKEEINFIQSIEKGIKKNKH